MSRFNFSASGVKPKPRVQNDIVYSTASARTGTSAMSSSRPQPYGGAYNSVYSSSIFGPKPSPLQSQSQAYRIKLHQSPLVQNRQERVNRHHEAAEEDDFLDQENRHLGDVNAALNKQPSDLIDKEKATSSKAVQRSPFGIVSGIRRLSIDGNSSTQEGEDVDVGRIFLPESISVRSNDYVKLPPVTAAPTLNAAGPRIAKPQKVYVQGGKKGQVPLESEVFNQGMFKTELCHKWQESGDCRYKDHYQLAQAGEELCPVSRQKRYKIKVCRMVLRGDVCPYGHRCHFRHALTEEEKQLAGGNNKPSSLQICSQSGSLHGTTILWIRLANVVLVGVDSMAIVTMKPDDIGNTREFQGLYSVTDNKFEIFDEGVFMTLCGDMERCKAMVAHVHKAVEKAKTDVVSTTSFDTICTAANDYFRSNPINPKVNHKSEVDICGWIDDEKIHRIVRVGDDFQDPLLMEDDCFGSGSGSAVVLSELQEMINKTMDVSKGVEVLKHHLITATIKEPNTGGVLKVYCLKEGSHKVRYEGNMMDELNDPKYAELVFDGHSMLVVIEGSHWDILTASDLKEYLLRKFGERVSRVYWLGWGRCRRDYLLLRVVLPSKKVRDEWFFSCKQFKAPVRYEVFTIAVNGRSCNYYLGFATKNLLDRARQMTSLEDLASTVKRY